MAIVSRNKGYAQNKGAMMDSVSMDPDGHFLTRWIETEAG
jgi:hypothetical protein